MNKQTIAIACLAFGMLTPLKAHAEPTVAELAARLDAVVKENAALRDRVRRLEAGRAEVVTARPNSGTRVHAAVAPQAAAGPVLYDAYKAPPLLPTPRNWTGPYVGASFGWGSQWSKQPMALSASGFGSQALGFNTIPNLVSSAAVASVPASVITDPNGFIAGGQVGYNYQIDRFVVGAEADLSATGIGGHASQMGAFAASFPANNIQAVSATTLINAEQHLDWLGTVRARVGYVPTSSLLLYATGGLAYGHVASSTAISLGVCTSSGAGGQLCNTATGAGSASAIQAGWAVGGGFEYALAEHWSVKAEYLHYDLGSLSYGIGALSMAVLNSPPNPANSITTNVGATARFNGDIGRVGLNYRFQ